MGWHIIWAFVGALIGGVLAWAVLPGLFWASLLGGAMTFGALRVGYVLIASDDGAQE